MFEMIVWDLLKLSKNVNHILLITRVRLKAMKINIVMISETFCFQFQVKLLILVASLIKPIWLNF